MSNADQEVSGRLGLSADRAGGPADPNPVPGFGPDGRSSTGAGELGPVDHFASIPRHIGIGMIGRKYRLVMREVWQGEVRETAYDDRLFDSVSDARREAAIAKARGQ